MLYEQELVCSHDDNQRLVIRQGQWQLTTSGTWTMRLGPGCQATMAICFWMVCTSGGSSGFVLYWKLTTPSASSLT
jgi:hypothetical protein